MVTDKMKSDEGISGEEFFCRKFEENINYLFFCSKQTGEEIKGYLKAGGIRIFFAEKEWISDQEWNSDKEWRVFGDPREDEKNPEIRQGLENSLKKNDKLEEKKMYGHQVKVLCFVEGKKLRDSRIEGKEIEGDYKSYKWIIVKESNGSAQFPKTVQELMGLILNKVKSHFEDFLWLQMYGNGFGKEVERYLFDGLQYEEDRDRIINRYIQRILRVNHLPDKEIFVQLSAQFYEKRALNARLCFSKMDQSEPFSSEICFCEGDGEIYREKRKLIPENLRTIRKLMETSGEKNALLVNTEDFSIVSLVKLDKYTEMPCVEFSGHLKWCLKKDGNVLFQYQDGKYGLWDIQKKEEYLEKIDCANIAKAEKEKIRNIINELKGQSHGTAIVFLDYRKEEGEKNQECLALKEAERLSKFQRAHLIEKVPLMKCKEKLLGITAIDGALLADFEGNCYAIGAILDGEAVVAGDSGRGARFNSIKNYVEWIFQNKISKPAVCMAVIFSEDKMIDVIFRETSDEAGKEKKKQ